jgi:hypothetical protein
MRKRKYDLYCDFDTALVSAAAAQQKNTIFARHIASGRKKEYDNRTAFKNWLKENPKWKPEQFEIEDLATIVGGVNNAVEGLLGRMSDIHDSNPVKSVKFVVGGPHGNFRDKIARIQPYKGQRPAKPLLFNDIKAKLLKRIPEYIVQPQINIESDDVCSIWLAEHREHGEDSDRAISSPDKDLKMCIGWHTDATRWDDAATYVKDFEGFYQLAYQSLRGDAIDNIMGIPHAVDSVRDKFGIRKGKGFGEVAATKCLVGCDTKEDLAKRVAWVYQETFKDGYELSDGTILSWVEVMDENVMLLKMLDYVGQQYKFSEEWGLA